MKIFILLLFPLMLSAQQNITLDGGLFKGQIQYPDTIESHVDTDIHAFADSWIADVEISKKRVAIYGYQNGDPSPVWVEEFLTGTKVETYYQDGRKHVYLIDEVDGYYAAVAYEKRVTKTSYKWVPIAIKLASFDESQRFFAFRK